MKFTIVAALASAAMMGVAVMPAMASSDAPVIALTNAYYGNTWRHQMVEAFEASAKEAKAAGQIADYIVMNGDGSVAQQNSQIAELILKKVDVLAVDAASETAVNGIIEKACKAVIIVVSFRGEPSPAGPWEAARRPLRRSRACPHPALPPSTPSCRAGSARSAT